MYNIRCIVLRTSSTWYMVVVIKTNWLGIFVFYLLLHAIFIGSHCFYEWEGGKAQWCGRFKIYLLCFHGIIIRSLTRCGTYTHTPSLLSFSQLPHQNVRGAVNVRSKYSNIFLPLDNTTIFIVHFPANSIH